MTRIKPESQHIMQKFQQEKKPPNLKVLTSLDDANTFKFKFENSDNKDENSGRTEQKQKRKPSRNKKGKKKKIRGRRSQ